MTSTSFPLVHSDGSTTMVSRMSHFLDISVEVRYTIYHYAVNEFRDYFSRYDLPVVARCRKLSKDEAREHIVPVELEEPDGLHGLMLVNRQVHDEIKDWFPKNREIRCNEFNSLAQLLGRETSTMVRDVRILSLNVNRFAQALVFAADDLEMAEPIPGPNRSETLDLLAVHTEEEIDEGIPSDEASDEFSAVKRQYADLQNFEKHFSYYGESYGDFCDRAKRLRLLEFSVNILLARDFDRAPAEFMDLSTERLTPILRMVPVGLVEGGIYRLCVRCFGEYEEETMEYVFRRVGNRLVEEDEGISVSLDGDDTAS